MQNKTLAASGMALALFAATATAQTETAAPAPTPTCADLHWTAGVLAQNPDIARTCLGVYELDGKLYAKGKIEVARVRGNRITFRPVYTDGSRGDSRSVTVPADFRATIAGRQYRADQLRRGQELDVFLPDDRFALAVVDTDGLDSGDLLAVEETAIAMPTTASPAFLFGALGAGLVGIGAALGRLRRRRGR